MKRSREGCIAKYGSSSHAFTISPCTYRLTVLFFFLPLLSFFFGSTRTMTMQHPTRLTAVNVITGEEGTPGTKRTAEEDVEHHHQLSFQMSFLTQRTSFLMASIQKGTGMVISTRMGMPPTVR